MSSSALIRLSAAARLSGRVGGAWCRLAGVRLAGSSAPLVQVQTVCWDSFGIWGNRTDLDLGPRTRTRTRDPDLGPKTRDPEPRTRDPDLGSRTRDLDLLGSRTRTRDPDLLGSRTRTRDPDLLGSRTRTRDRIGVSSVQGLRRQNEDRLRVSRLHDNVLYAAVFDGHGGTTAAEYCHAHMEDVIRGVLEFEDDLEEVLKKSFLETDQRLKTHLIDCNQASLLSSGSTATVAMLRDGVELVVGSVGDSRALLCRGGGAYALTTDHKPDRSDERLRITRSGGFFTWNGVGEANVNGRLAMTRSIGDFSLKTSGVIADPETTRVHVQDSDSFLALTTDGVNFLLSDQEICDVINRCDDPHEAADVITQQALQYGGEDNASIVVVALGAWRAPQTQTRTQTQTQTRTQTRTRIPAVYSLSRTFSSGGRWA